MSMPGIGNPVRGGQFDNSVWRIEFSWPTTTSVLISQTGGKSDRDERVVTPVAYTSTGLVAIKFPKCQNAQAVGCNLDSATARIVQVTDVNPTAGTANVRFFNGSLAATDAAALSIVTVTLLLNVQ